jgi:hypothetical protein
MEASLSHSLVRLAAEDLLRVQAVRGQCVAVFHGKVWITQQDDLRDYVVTSGETFTFDRAGLALVEALEPTTLVVLVEATPAPEPIGYEAAWPQTQPAQAQARQHAAQEAARTARSPAGRGTARGVAHAARKAWSDLTGGSLRQAA